MVSMDNTMMAVAGILFATIIAAGICAIVVVTAIFKAKSKEIDRLDWKEIENRDFQYKKEADAVKPLHDAKMFTLQHNAKVLQNKELQKMAVGLIHASGTVVGSLRINFNPSNGTLTYELDNRPMPSNIIHPTLVAPTTYPMNSSEVSKGHISVKPTLVYSGKDFDRITITQLDSPSVP